MDVIKPTVLVGTPTGDDSKGLFTKPILNKLAENNDKPIILALSTPYPECTADEAYVDTHNLSLSLSLTIASALEMPNIRRKHTSDR